MNPTNNPQEERCCSNSSKTSFRLEIRIIAFITSFVIKRILDIIDGVIDKVPRHVVIIHEFTVVFLVIRIIAKRTHDTFYYSIHTRSNNQLTL